MTLDYPLHLIDPADTSPGAALLAVREITYDLRRIAIERARSWHASMQQ